MAERAIGVLSPDHRLFRTTGPEMILLKWFYFPKSDLFITAFITTHSSLGYNFFSGKLSLLILSPPSVYAFKVNLELSLLKINNSR